MAEIRRSSDSGRPIGDDHHRTRIPDWAVRAMRDAYEFEDLTVEEVRVIIGRRLGMVLSYSTVKSILFYQRRNVQARLD